MRAGQRGGERSPALARNGAEAVSVETLLGRTVVDLRESDFAAYLADATVLVTGAGGSLGTELCARLAGLGVRELVLVDQAEAALIELATTLRYERGFSDTVAVLADIRSKARALEVFERYRPDVVFHAAAYKHVALVEAHPVEGVATNVLGTKHLVDAARAVGVQRFVLFSTDKAVEPTSVLGQTKAVAEWLVASASQGQAPGRYTSVRLGNVADSAASILPLFRRQVALGGPVTVTHPEMTRYLMTAGEAASLAVVAGALGDSNGVFFLDVGSPVRVLDLARRLVGASDDDVAIAFVGLRAGERLHEQLFRRDDEITVTACPRVLRAASRKVNSDWLGTSVAALARHVERASAAGVRAVLAEMYEFDEPDAAVPSGAIA